MKRYKLKKALPTFKVGDIFYLTESKNLFHESDGRIRVIYNCAEIDKFPNIFDWFEEIKETTRWKPERNQKYHCVGSDGRIYDDAWDDFLSGTAQDRFDMGNCFQTKEEAERVVEYLKALAVVRGDATSKFDKKSLRNWHVTYDSRDNHLYASNNFYRINNGVFDLPYFATSDDARRSIELHKKEWRIIFGVTED